MTRIDNENVIILQALYAKLDLILKDMKNYDFMYNQSKIFNTPDEFVAAMQDDVRRMQAIIDTYHTINPLIEKYQALVDKNHINPN